MATEITINDGAGLTSKKTVTESVADVTDAVNVAIQVNQKFVVVTAEDGKSISVEAAKVLEVGEA